ncbi:helix-turn-helix transcriptional regulator [Thiohalocapsa marina]|uniref:Helix-turn-helix transcriptional regulator n=1 Tax=Thiohalocapsa marina TaxID=424902 RepID=A0A5M8FI57_9GAMM|nr:helix-turn-helix transcriptional regulator [Thiohalocapsa marina]KAA6183650.1 helix-turn-helix transcriptional regulator [Thiohalocapsa marina]
MNEETKALTETIANRLRTARAATGLSLKQLSDKTQGRLTKSRISNYEQGLRRLRIESAEILAQALGNVTTAHLLCLDEGELRLNDEEQRLLEVYRSADELGRATIMGVADHEYRLIAGRPRRGRPRGRAASRAA